MDSRGVLRGGCTLCKCRLYVLKNVPFPTYSCECDHAPAKHHKIENWCEDGMLANSRASSSAEYGLDQGGKESLCGDEKMDTEAPAPLCHQCAGCDQELSEGMRKFTYCSPSCRDKYLLGSNFDKTKNEIRQLEQLLPLSCGGLEFMYTEACEKSPCSTCTALHKTVAAAGKDSSSSSRTSKHSHSTTGSTRSTNTFKGNTATSKNDSSSSSHTSKHSHLTAGSTRSADTFKGNTAASKNDSSSSSHTSNLTTCSTRSADTFKGNTAASKNDSSSSSHTSKHSYSTAVKRKQQNEIKVKISKYGRERVGLLFSELPDAATHGFIITGFEIHSPAFKFFKNDQLHLLDIVLRVNGVEFKDPGCFDDKVADSLCVDLHCSRSIGLPAMSRILAESLSVLQPSTHVFVLRCTLPTVKIGIDFRLYEDEIHVTAVEKGSVGRESGIKFGDCVKGCVMVTKNNEEFSKELLIPAGLSLQTYINKLEECFAAAIKNKCNVVLFVRRS